MSFQILKLYPRIELFLISTDTQKFMFISAKEKKC